MTNTQGLSTTEEIVNRLEREYNSCYKEIVDSISNCIAHKSDFMKVKGRNPVLCPQWERSGQILDARDSLHYRLGALIWQVRMFREQQLKHANIISKLKVKGVDNENEKRDAYCVMSYLLDNVIFNSVSGFDYLSELIFRIDIPNAKGNRLWSTIVNHKMLNKLEDQGLASLLLDIHGSFVKKLSRLRGMLIHNQAEICDLEFEEEYSETGVKHSFQFLMPETIVGALPIFSENAKISIEPGAAMIAIHTMNSVRRVIDLVGKYEYVCVYNPHKK